MTTKLLLLLRNVAFSLLLAGIFVAQQLQPAVFKIGALWSDHPCWWQFFTNGFLSGNSIHLALNMTGMWVICSQFAAQIRLFFLLIYFVLFSAVSSFLYFHFIMPPHATLVGASGGIYALMGFLCWLQRRDRIGLFGLRRLATPFVPAMLILLMIEFLIATFWIPVLAWQLHIIAFSISILTAMTVHAVYAGIHWLAGCNRLMFRGLFEQLASVLRTVKRVVVNVPAAAEQ